MAEISDAFDQWMRDYVTDGVPASGVNPPSKAEGRALGPIIEAYIDAKVVDLVNTILGAPPATPGPYVMPTFVAYGDAHGVIPTVLADDILLMQVHTNGSGIIRPSGWTQIGSELSQGGVAYALYWHRCDGTESGDTVTVTSSVSSPFIWTAISAWRGCVANGDPYEAADTNHGDGNPMTGRSVTTTDVQRRVVNLFGFAARLGGGGGSSPDVGFVEAGRTADALNDIYFIADTAAEATPATAPAESRTVSNIIYDWAVFSLALLPTS